MNTFFLLAFWRLSVLAHQAAAQARARGKGGSQQFSSAPRAGQQCFFLPGSFGRVAQFALEPESSALLGRTENPVVGAWFVCAGFALSLQRSVGLSQAPNWSFNRTCNGIHPWPHSAVVTVTPCGQGCMPPQAG